MIFTRVRNHWFVMRHCYRFGWRDFISILDVLSQHSELERLVLWSHRKRLRGVNAHYSRLLQDVEGRLSFRAMQHPYLSEIAKWVYCAVTMLNPPPHIYPKGAGAKYSLRN